MTFQVDFQNDLQSRAPGRVPGWPSRSTSKMVFQVYLPGWPSRSESKMAFQDDRQSSLNEPESDLGRKQNRFGRLGPQVGPDRRNFKSYSHITALQPAGTVPGPLRPTFGLPGQPAGQPAGQLAGQLAGRPASWPASWPATEARTRARVQGHVVGCLPFDSNSITIR